MKRLSKRSHNNNTLLAGWGRFLSGMTALLLLASCILNPIVFEETQKLISPESGADNSWLLFWLLPSRTRDAGGATNSTTTAPSAPTGFTATEADGQITMSWTAVSGATSYNLYRGTSTGVTTATGTKIAGVTSSYTDTGLTNGTAYYYIVTAVNAVGESAASSEASATPVAAVTIPNAPTGLSATAGDGQITLSWTAVSGATSYNLYRGTSTGVTTATGTKIAGVTSSYTDTGLTNGTTYYYIVTAVNAVGESTASSEASATPVAAVVIPAAPTGLSATAGDGQITLSWTAVSGATSYNLYRGTSTGVTTATGTKIAGVTSSYTDTGLTGGTTYYYIVTAVNAVGESTASSEASATPVAAVTTLAPLRTYQTTCWDASGITIPCAGTGQDGEYQAGRNTNFTGPTQHATYTSDYTTTDNAMGLVWKTCSEGKSGATCGTGTATTMTWATATGSGTGCDALNSANSAAGYAGLTNWRLPSIRELETIINYSTSNPAAFSAGFPGTVATIHWSSFPYVPVDTNAWVVNFFSGLVAYNSKTSPFSVRCVSPGPGYVAPAPVYADQGNGTVKDNATGLVWQKCSSGQTNDASCSGTATTANWTGALSYCNSLSLAGRSWRLPNTNELKSIVDRSKASGAAIDLTSFPATVSDKYWSASTYVSTKANGWFVDFSGGIVNNISKTNIYYARCVSN